MENKNKTETIPNVNIEYFNKIIKLCQENDIMLVLFGVPSMKSWSYAKDQKINELSNEYGLEFIDLNNILEIDWVNETKDEGSHLNYSGAKKVSHYLGNYLFENNLVVNHKDDNKYDDWNKAYSKYQRLIDFN